MFVCSVYVFTHVPTEPTSRARQNLLVFRRGSLRAPYVFERVVYYLILLFYLCLYLSCVYLRVMNVSTVRSYATNVHGFIFLNYIVSNTYCGVLSTDFSSLAVICFQLVTFVFNLHYLLVIQ